MGEAYFAEEHRRNRCIARGVVCLIVCLHSLLSVAPMSHGQTSPVACTVYGTVRLPDGSPASRVVVQVNSQVNPPLEVFTSDLGRYEIPNLPRGHFWLCAVNRSAPEMRSDSVEVEVSRTSPARLLINLYLRGEPNIQFDKREGTATLALAEAAQRVPRAARKAVEQARAFRQAKEWDKSLQSLNRAIKLFPGYFQALAERGHLQVSLLRPKEAEADFTRALKLNTRYEPALRGLGICRFQEGRFEDAIACFERAISEAPGAAVDYLLLGICNAQLGRQDAARAALHRALVLDPAGAARAHVHLANLEIKENRPQDAIAQLEAYLAALPNASDADSQRRLIAQLRKSRSEK